MIDRKLSDLDPDLRILATKIMLAANAAIAPSKVAITVTWRSPADQRAAKANGLSKAGPGESPHNYCLANGSPSAKAFDFAVFDADGKYITDGTDPRYATVGNLATAAGLLWGGNWKPSTDGCNPDPDHIECANWRVA